MTLFNDINSFIEFVETRKRFSKKVSFVLDDNMKAYAKSKIPELNKEEIEILMKEGYLIREIKRGVKIPQVIS